jgi:hypothetical protein
VGVLLAILGWFAYLFVLESVPTYICNPIVVPYPCGPPTPLNTMILENVTFYLAVLSIPVAVFIEIIQWRLKIYHSHHPKMKHH